MSVFLTIIGINVLILVAILIYAKVRKNKTIDKILKGKKDE